jgi:ATP-binding cassette subfamily B protein
LTALDKIPSQALGVALPKILAQLGLPPDFSLDQLRTTLQSDFNDAPRALMTALIAILVFAVLRGVFAFLQTFWAEKNSQAVAYDLRNDLYAKIQRFLFLP